MKRYIALFLSLVLLLGVMPVFAAEDAMEEADLQTVLNSVELKPQRTGYPQVDAILEEIMSSFEATDNYTLLKEVYNWVTMEVNYSWGPYSQNWAPAYDCFVPLYDLEYEEGLEEAMPFEVVNRSYHALVEREGICYDYGALFAVMARYLGFESYVHTGDFIFEEGFGTGSGHHGWAEIEIEGKYYIFDPQRDYRMSANATAPNPYMYFGIDEEHAWRYDHETAVNEARDAGFLSVHAPRMGRLNVLKTDGTVLELTGAYPVGEMITLKAPVLDAPGMLDFWGWYDEDGTLLSSDLEYTFLMENGKTLYCVEGGEYFCDIAGLWYEDDANAALELGLVEGVGAFRFNGEGTMSRAMALTVLYRMAAPEETDIPTASYIDVEQDTWYTDAVNWGTYMGIVNGVGKDRFNPNGAVTREQFITMMMRLWAGDRVADLALSYADLEDISSYALDSIRTATALGLLTGYEDNTLRPQKQLSRAEAVTLLMRHIRTLEPVE